MRKSLKKVFFILVRISGIPYLLRLLKQKNVVTVIYYHDVDPISFKKHVQFIKKKYSIIEIHSLLSFLNYEEKKLPNYPLLITFDDGHAGNSKLFNIIKETNIHPVIFLSTEAVNDNVPFWFKLPFEKSAAKDYLKKCADDERRKIISEKYQKYFSDNRDQALKWDHVREMTPWVNFQSHTHTHPCLPNCDNEKVVEELEVSKQLIEKNTSEKVFAIAYPNGDVTDREVSSAVRLGFTLGFTGIPGFVSKDSNPLLLPRLSMNDTKDLNEFVVRITGTWFLFKKILRWINK